MSVILLLELCIVLAACECCSGPWLLCAACAALLYRLALLGTLVLPLGWGYLCTMQLVFRLHAAACRCCSRAQAAMCMGQPGSSLLLLLARQAILSYSAGRHRPATQLPTHALWP